jgi:enoyl-CoA hydratase/carnithine racemase
MSDELLYEVNDGIGLITLNRPDRLNAWTPSMGAEYLAALDDAGSNPGVRVVVVTGAGRGFCAGADMGLLSELAGGERTEGERVSGETQRPPSRMEPGVPKPVIAAINGACAGLGLVRAMFCDIRFAASGAKFTTAFARRGLVAEHGLSWLLPRLAGVSRSLDVLFSGRVFLAEEALQLGLVNRVVDGDVLAAAMDYARELATYSSPASMADMKRQIWTDAVTELDEAWARAEKLMLASFTRPDLAEGVASYVEGRDPKFPPLEG